MLLLARTTQRDQDLWTAQGLAHSGPQAFLRTRK